MDKFYFVQLNRNKKYSHYSLIIISTMKQVTRERVNQFFSLVSTREKKNSAFIMKKKKEFFFILSKNQNILIE